MYDDVTEQEKAEFGCPTPREHREMEDGNEYA